KTDIDKETYNQIKLVRPNEDTGKGDVYIVKDGETISRWGTLQYYDVVDENMNAAQIQQQAETMLTYYNRKLRTISFSNCLGIPKLRAGSMVLSEIPKLGDINLDAFLLVDSATHHFTESFHFMDFECRIPIK
ncbi:MAG: hypothetical protein LBN43_05875, partial [Oscillospiraceae bacterium]|nr:hypothetical protein [Oscillospiraceae bacterium]